MTIGPGYMNPRKREEVVDRMCDTLLAVLNDVDDADYKVMRLRQVIHDYERFINYHKDQDKRAARRQASGANDGKI